MAFNPDHIQYSTQLQSQLRKSLASGSKKPTGSTNNTTTTSGDNGVIAIEEINYLPWAGESADHFIKRSTRFALEERERLRKKDHSRPPPERPSSAAGNNQVFCETLTPIEQVDRSKSGYGMRTLNRTSDPGQRYRTTASAATTSNNKVTSSISSSSAPSSLSSLPSSSKNHNAAVNEPTSDSSSDKQLISSPHGSSSLMTSSCSAPAAVSSLLFVSNKHSNNCDSFSDNSSSSSSKKETYSDNNGSSSSNKKETVGSNWESSSSSTFIAASTSPSTASKSSWINNPNNRNNSSPPITTTTVNGEITTTTENTTANSHSSSKQYFLVVDDSGNGKRRGPKSRRQKSTPASSATATPTEIPQTPTIINTSVHCTPTHQQIVRPASIVAPPISPLLPSPTSSISTASKESQQQQPHLQQHPNNNNNNSNPNTNDNNNAYKTKSIITSNNNSNSRKSSLGRLTRPPLNNKTGGIDDHHLCSIPTPTAAATDNNISNNTQSSLMKMASSPLMKYGPPPPPLSPPPPPPPLSHLTPPDTAGGVGRLCAPQMLTTKTSKGRINLSSSLPPPPTQPHEFSLPQNIMMISSSDNNKKNIQRRHSSCRNSNNSGGSAEENHEGGSSSSPMSSVQDDSSPRSIAAAAVTTRNVMTIESRRRSDDSRILINDRVGDEINNARRILLPAAAKATPFINDSSDDDDDEDDELPLARLCGPPKKLQNCSKTLSTPPPQQKQKQQQTSQFKEKKEKKISSSQRKKSKKSAKNKQHVQQQYDHQQHVKTLQVAPSSASDRAKAIVDALNKRKLKNLKSSKSTSVVNSSKSELISDHEDRQLLQTDNEDRLPPNYNSEHFAPSIGEQNTETKPLIVGGQFGACALKSESSDLSKDYVACKFEVGSDDSDQATKTLSQPLFGGTKTNPFKATLGIDCSDWEPNEIIGDPILPHSCVDDENDDMTTTTMKPSTSFPSSSNKKKDVSEIKTKTTPKRVSQRQSDSSASSSSASKSLSKQTDRRCKGCNCDMEKVMKKANHDYRGSSTTRDEISSVADELCTKCQVPLTMFLNDPTEAVRRHPVVLHQHNAEGVLRTPPPHSTKSDKACWFWRCVNIARQHNISSSSSQQNESDNPPQKPLNPNCDSFFQVIQPLEKNPKLLSTLHQHPTTTNCTVKKKTKKQTLSALPFLNYSSSDDLTAENSISDARPVSSSFSADSLYRQPHTSDAGIRISSSNSFVLPRGNDESKSTDAPTLLYGTHHQSCTAISGLPIEERDLIINADEEEHMADEILPPMSPRRAFIAELDEGRVQRDAFIAKNTYKLGAITAEEAVKRPPNPAFSVRPGYQPLIPPMSVRLSSEISHDPVSLSSSKGGDRPSQKSSTAAATNDSSKRYKSKAAAGGLTAAESPTAADSPTNRNASPTSDVAPQTNNNNNNNSGSNRRRYPHRKVPTITYGGAEANDDDEDDEDDDDEYDGAAVAAVSKKRIPRRGNGRRVATQVYNGHRLMPIASLSSKEPAPTKEPASTPPAPQPDVKPVISSLKPSKPSKPVLSSSKPSSKPHGVEVAARVEESAPSNVPTTSSSAVADHTFNKRLQGTTTENRQHLKSSDQINKSSSAAASVPRSNVNDRGSTITGTAENPPSKSSDQSKSASSSTAPVSRNGNDRCSTTRMVTETTPSKSSDRNQPSASSSTSTAASRHSNTAVTTGDHCEQKLPADAAADVTGAKPEQSDDPRPQNKSNSIIDPDDDPEWSNREEHRLGPGPGKDRTRNLENKIQDIQNRRRKTWASDASGSSAGNRRQKRSERLKTPIKSAAKKLAIPIPIKSTSPPPPSSFLESNPSTLNPSSQTLNSDSSTVSSKNTSIVSTTTTTTTIATLTSHSPLPRKSSSHLTSALTPPPSTSDTTLVGNINAKQSSANLDKQTEGSLPTPLNAAVDSPLLPIPDNNLPPADALPPTRAKGHQPSESMPSIPSKSVGKVLTKIIDVQQKCSLRKKTHSLPQNHEETDQAKTDQMNVPSTSVIGQTTTSQFDVPSTSVTDQTTTSQINVPSTSATDQIRTSQINVLSTSVIDQTRTSQINVPSPSVTDQAGTDQTKSASVKNSLHHQTTKKSKNSSKRHHQSSKRFSTLFNGISGVDSKVIMTPGTLKTKILLRIPKLAADTSSPPKIPSYHDIHRNINNKPENEPNTTSLPPPSTTHTTVWAQHRHQLNDSSHPAVVTKAIGDSDDSDDDHQSIPADPHPTSPPNPNHRTSHIPTKLARRDPSIQANTMEFEPKADVASPSSSASNTSNRRQNGLLKVAVRRTAASAVAEDERSTGSQQNSLESVEGNAEMLDREPQPSPPPLLMAPPSPLSVTFPTRYSPLNSSFSDDRMVEKTEADVKHRSGKSAELPLPLLSDKKEKKSKKRRSESPSVVVAKRVKTKAKRQPQSPSLKNAAAVPPLRPFTATSEAPTYSILKRSPAAESKHADATRYRYHEEPKTPFVALSNKNRTAAPSQFIPPVMMMNNNNNNSDFNASAAADDDRSESPVILLEKTLKQGEPNLETEEEEEEEEEDEEEEYGMPELKLDEDEDPNESFEVLTDNDEDQTDRADPICGEEMRACDSSSSSISTTSKKPSKLSPEEPSASSLLARRKPKKSREVQKPIKLIIKTATLTLEKSAILTTSSGPISSTSDSSSSFVSPSLSSPEIPLTSPEIPLTSPEILSRSPEIPSTSSSEIPSTSSSEIPSTSSPEIPSISTSEIPSTSLTEIPLASASEIPSTSSCNDDFPVRDIEIPKLSNSIPPTKSATPPQTPSIPSSESPSQLNAPTSHPQHETSSSPTPTTNDHAKKRGRQKGSKGGGQKQSEFMILIASAGKMLNLNTGAGRRSSKLTDHAFFSGADDSASATKRVKPDLLDKHPTLFERDFRIHLAVEDQLDGDTIQQYNSKQIKPSEKELMRWINRRGPYPKKRPAWISVYFGKEEHEKDQNQIKQPVRKNPPHSLKKSAALIPDKDSKQLNSSKDPPMKKSRNLFEDLEAAVIDDAHLPSSTEPKLADHDDFHEKNKKKNDGETEAEAEVLLHAVVRNVLNNILSEII